LVFSNPKIADYLVLDIRTEKKYLLMTEENYEKYLLKGQYRSNVLSPYETFVREKLGQDPETSAAQIHDWLKEHHPEFPHTNLRTAPIGSLPKKDSSSLIPVNYKRDTSKSLDQMMLLATSYFTDKDMAVQYLQKINQKLPRYIRDHLDIPVILTPLLILV